MEPRRTYARAFCGEDKGNFRGPKNQFVRRRRIEGLAGRVLLSAATMLLLVAYATGTYASAQAPAVKAYQSASIKAEPGLQCNLHSAGTQAAGVPVFTDSDGFARFQAVPAAKGDATAALTLDCKNSQGTTSSFPVDLSSVATFASHPVDLALAPGVDRPALSGNPLSHTQADLLKLGYGLRPDAVKDAGAYALWLQAASKAGRMLNQQGPNLHEHTVTTPGNSGGWAGSVLTGAPNYISTIAVFNVPKAIPGGDQTGTTEIAIWNGLGGYGTGSGLIQGGLSVYTTPTAASYSTWREYCCGDPDSNSRGGVAFGGNFVPNPGEQIFSQEWYCDASGNLNINGGYGCTFLENLTTGAILNCTNASGKPCWSVKANPLCSANPKAANCMTLGQAAEFIIENQSPQVSPTSTAFTDFTPAITMSGFAYSSQTNSYSKSITTDPGVNLLTDWTKTGSHLVVGLGGTNQTTFTMEPTQPSFGLYCLGPLITTNWTTFELTSFQWASTGAHAKAPGPGQCTWYDRGPRPGEIRPGNSGIIYGFVNNHVDVSGSMGNFGNIPAGQYVVYDVYTDPNIDNYLVVTAIPGFAKPPF